jgi:hypothetical protein
MTKLRPPPASLAIGSGSAGQSAIAAVTFSSIN